MIKVDTINATFQPEKIGHPNGLQITYLRDYSTRNIFVYHENGKVLHCTCVYLSLFNLMQYNTIKSIQYNLKIRSLFADDNRLKMKHIFD